MIKSTVEPACTGLFAPIFMDYIQNKENLKPFYRQYPSLGNFGKILKEKKFDQHKRNILAASFLDQYRSVKAKGKVVENIDLLQQENTFTVTTGHQLNLMTGPLYFIYKIVSTINLAEKLGKAYPQYNFIPIYWMASEDHDFAEINHFSLDGNRYEWQTDQKGAVGDFQLDAPLQELIRTLPFLPDFLKKAYTENDNLADAVRYYVNYLFGDKGLLVMDANRPELKRMFAPVIKDDLLKQKANELVSEKNSALGELGYKSQVHPREINFFYLEKGLRERIVKRGQSFQVLNTDYHFTEDQLLKSVDIEPEKFSPNVVMRPLYQEYILPNLAYLGGPAEVAYWFQLKGVFDYYQVDFPFILPRNFALVVNERVGRKIKQLDLQGCDLFKGLDQLRVAFVHENAKEDLNLTREKERLEQVFLEISEIAETVDPTLKMSAEAAKKRSLKILDHFSIKLRKAEEKNHSVAIRQLADIKEYLFPQRSLQERKVNFLNFYLEKPSFIEELFEHFDPFDFNFLILHPDEIKRSN